MAMMLPDDDSMVMAYWLAANPTWLARIEDHLARVKAGEIEVTLPWRM